MTEFRATVLISMCVIVLLSPHPDKRRQGDKDQEEARRKEAPL